MTTNTAEVIGQAIGAMIAKAGKYLTFKLGVEEYGLEILKVQEIMKMVEVTKVPRTPDYVRGVINLRGKVIPVVDLRLKFGMATKETTDKTCVIVVQVKHQSNTVTTGTIVDEVSEVLDIHDEQIELAPEFDTSVNTDFILGMGKVAKKVIMLLDIDKVLTSGGTARLKESVVHAEDPISNKDDPKMMDVEPGNSSPDSLGREPSRKRKPKGKRSGKA